MIKINDELLHKLQMTELEMIIEVDRICRKNDIKYSLDGGTLLGAIRHNGFIPWDDDVDIVMLREEYEKFFEACKTDLDRERFFLQDYRTDEQYLWGFSKMRRNNSVFLREGQEHIACHTGICIDIFLYDNVPDNWLARRLHLFLCFCIRKGQYARVGKKNAKSLLVRDFFALISKIPRNFWFKQIEWLAGITNRKKTELVRHMTYPYRKECRYGLPRECFDEYIDKDFEGYNFRILKKYDLYLTTLYGEYMELPPVEKRRVHPASRIVLPE